MYTLNKLRSPFKKQIMNYHRHLKYTDILYCVAFLDHSGQTRGSKGKVAATAFESARLFRIRLNSPLITPSLPID